MPLQGNLRDFSTTQLLNLVNLSKRTGLLTIFDGITTNELDAMKQPKQIPGAERARIAFHQGRLVYASAANQDSSLVAVLNKAGKLNNEQARQLRERMGSLGDKGLAMRLIGAKYVTQGDILAAVKQNILDIVFNLMTLQEGPFRFDDNQSPGSDVILVPIELEPVIIEGGRRIKEAGEIDKVIGSLDVSLKFAENAKQKFKGVHLTVDEWKIVPYVDPKNTLRQIMKVVNMSELQIKRIVYSLNQAGLIEIVNSAKPQVLPQRPNRPTKPPTPPEKRVVLSIIEKLKSM
ncbi:DUF4388 domain-containing protein [Aggregatilineales bacterium SYSU G02658]